MTPRIATLAAQGTEVDRWAWDWTAIGSVATAVGVLLALVVALVQLRDLILLRKREAQDRRREQALQVSAWATSETEFPDTPSSNIVGNPWFASIHVLNGSNSSISDVRVAIGYRFNGQWHGLQEVHEWLIVPPGEAIRADFRQSHVRSFASPQSVLLCRLRFRDSNNVCWQRDARNVLTELRDETE
ncbi:hypothetical protein ACQPWR_25685 [Micromonospora vinacea]|uniref:hypothetical protein n=1 Tax=Micromonospora vinacea TaxID=709878 RepID=UPI003D92B921